MRARLAILLLVALGLLAGCRGCGSEAPPALTVFCGSASKPAMEEIAKAFEGATGVAVELLFGGSGALLSQMELTEKGDIYLPGSPDYVLIAERKKQIFPGSARIVAYLVPTIITPGGNPAGVHTLEDLARPGVRVGLGNPKTVCLGLYAVELLERAGLLDRVLPNVVTFGASCSKTANLAAMAQVDAILGWGVFHHWNPERMEQVPIDPARIPRISYIPIAIPVHTRDRALSERFIDFVLSPRGRAAYAHFGYLIDEAAARALAPQATIGGEYSLPADYPERVRHIGTGTR